MEMRSWLGFSLSSSRGESSCCREEDEFGGAGEGGGGDRDEMGFLPSDASVCLMEPPLRASTCASGIPSPVGFHLSSPTPVF